MAKLGSKINIDGTVWECISSTKDILVLKKHKSSTDSVKVNDNYLGYLKEVTLQDLKDFYEYHLKDIGFIAIGNIFYIAYSYMGIQNITLSQFFKKSPSNITNSILNIKSSLYKVDKADKIALSLGYWKYKQLTNKT